jgi:undecaprenyl-diphosphatase
VIKVGMALGVSVLVSFMLGHRSRTIVLLSITRAIPSCTTRRMTPSRAITAVIFTFALAFLFWHRLWSGALLMVVAGNRLVSRLSGRPLAAGYGGRFPRGADWLRERGDPVESLGQALYRGLSRFITPFAIPIRKGWIRD